jgi:N-acetylated-alpha-linked acidic dipeptidase
MRTITACIALAFTCVVAVAGDAPTPSSADFSMSRFVPSRRATQSEFEKNLLEGIDPKRLRAWHDLVASEPHVAGTPGDLRQIDRLAKAFAEMGLEVETHWIWPYLCKPVSAEVEIVAPASAAKKLGVSEPPIDSDKYTRNPDLIPLAWNAYSGSGDATANIVYCNYGTKADFEKLKELGVETKGTIALARYGGNFRGYKAKFAQDAGCIGLIIFIDPADSGYAKGPAYPEGGWATPTQVQCGSILTTAWAGDPLTPMIEATENAPRVTPEEAGLPKIPVQPIGWESAQPILKAMTGEPVADRVPGWQGGLPTPYRLTGGAELKVRLKVEQTRAITKTANVIATLKGAKEPEKKIIIGCHHDAWNHGACDPTCGLILVLEVAKVMSDLAKAGHPPDRSILFCGWGAEEFGILGSVEWVEKNLADLEKNGVAYINLDMATMGANFSASSAPSLRSLIYDAARIVPNAPVPSATSLRRPTKDAPPPVSPGSVFNTWLARTMPTTPAAPATATPSPIKEGEPAKSPKPAETPEPPIGDLGGGSDHIGFVCHALVPSISLGSGGSRGTSYHSIYDTLDWYRAVVGDDYLPAQMNARMTAVIASRLANADVLPMDPRRVATDIRKQLTRISEAAMAKGLSPDSLHFEGVVQGLEDAAESVHSRANFFIASAGPSGVGPDFRWWQMGLDRVWKVEEGLPGRKWFRNGYAASDRDSGYAPWILPMLEQAIEDGDQAALDQAGARYRRMVKDLVGYLSIQ